MGAQDYQREPRLANDYKIVTVDLGTARSDSALGLSGISLTIIDKGTGNFSFKFNDKGKDAITQDDVADGSVFEIEFSEIYFTNTAQAGLSVKLYIARIQ